MLINESTEIKELICSAIIQDRIKNLGAEITQQFIHKVSIDNPLIVIGVLKGAYIFTADLVRHIKLPIQVEFVRIASYGDNTVSSGIITAPDLSLPANIYNHNILIVEDIVDTGQTAKFLYGYILEQFRPQSLKLVSFLNKPSRRIADIDPDLCGFTIEDKFVIGYGLDYAERYRELPYLAYIDLD